MGTRSHSKLAALAEAVAQEYSLVLEIEHLDSTKADPGTLIDLMEVLQESGFSAVDLRDRAAQVIAPMSDWTSSALDSGVCHMPRRSQGASDH